MILKMKFTFCLTVQNIQQLETSFLVKYITGNLYLKAHTNFNFNYPTVELY